VQRLIANVVSLTCALSVMDPTVTNSAPSQSIRVGAWSGGPSFNAQSKQFENCVARISNPQGISIIYTVDRQYRWRLSFSNPTWSFLDGYSLSLLLTFDQRTLVRHRAVVLGGQTLDIQSHDDLSLFVDLWSANRLKVTAGALNFDFELISSNEVLAALMQCAMRHANPARVKSATPVSFRIDSATRDEVRALANELLISSRVRDAQFLAGSGNSQDPAVAWKSGLITSTLDVIDPKEVSSFQQMPLRILDREGRTCRSGLFFAWELQDVDQTEMLRTFTACPSPEGAIVAYYAVVPRGKGGYYLLTSTASGSGFGGVVQQQLGAMDSRLRTGLIFAANRVDQKGMAEEASTAPADLTLPGPSNQPLPGRD